MTVMMSFVVFAQRENYVFIHNNDLALLLNGEGDIFEEVIIFQGDDLRKLNIRRIVKIGIKEYKFDGNKLILFTNNNESYEFNPNGTNISEKSFGGYGLSRRKGRIVLERNRSDNNIFNLIHVEAIRFDKLVMLGDNTKCHSGGEGASECSAKGDNFGILTMECSVTCRDTHYACCDDTRGECVCKRIESVSDEKPKSNGIAIPMQSYILTGTLMSDIDNKEHGFNVYPNPTNNSFRIESINPKMDYKVYIIDMGGKIIERNDSIKGEISLEKYDKGIYLFKVLNNNNYEIYTGKIVKN